jgi:hypothetical protein
MKLLKKTVIASLIAIAMIETRHHIATAQQDLPRPVSLERALPRHESRLYRIRRKVVLRAERLVAPLKARVNRGERPRWR